MKVCDKCKRPIKTSHNPLKLKNTIYELCDVCFSKVEMWLIRPEGVSKSYREIKDDLKEMFGVRRKK